ncbi:phage/plasmid primase, P4 family [Bradyrhizobium sp. Arg816]|uniref:phage/plasmid primase, P4 family n=1 Tax=Bradyrhizobium sp. Arg816 TaxID=2998491 RepID=UPI00249EC985|nr:phage/plasmid primase, P4 family [Bradyrhizobium sp. Arg816]MDI3565401.1 phage/plasmid primase, P4 family [Bradyrhizobium sp. Arg816]
MNKPFDVHRLVPNDIVTEDNAAQQFVELHGDKLRHCHSHGKWFRWNGFYWEINNTNLAFHHARELARQLAEDQSDGKRYKISATGFAGGVERFAKSDPSVAVTMEFWDRDPWLLGTPGGTVDLRTGALRHASREDGITKVTSVAPDDSGCPRWLRFLVETTGDDGELIRFLQQWCGYCLTGVTREHALVFVYGPGGNGKSVFLNILTTILKDYSVTSAMETFTASTNDRHSTEVAMLAGARLVTASETEEGRAWAEARIKSVTGGEKITARFMRQDNFTYMPQFKLIVIGNHKPVLHNVDDAAKRRFNIVPFILKPATPDRDLEQKLMQEAPGILKWMIDGCLDWQQNGLVRPKCVIEATAEYFGDQDLFRHWLEEECICEPGNIDISEASSVLFGSWSNYAKAAGNKPGTTATFKDNLTAAGFKFYRSEKAREFFGISLKPKASFDGGYP